MVLSAFLADETQNDKRAIFTRISPSLYQGDWTGGLASLRVTTVSQPTQGHGCDMGRDRRQGELSD